MLRESLRDGFKAVGRSPGLVLLLLAVNIGLAALLALPLARTLEKDLRQTEAAANMMYGFDYGWWSQWSDSQSGWTSSFAPDIFGAGFAFKNGDLLLKGHFPAGLFVTRDERAIARDERAGPEGEPAIDRVILGLGLLYLVVQLFLTGGVLGVLRAPQGHWTVRGLLHGAGFYFGRFLRLGLIALLADYLLFRLNVPFARWADARAREAVSENTAMAWLLGRHALLLLGILFVHMVSSYAKVIVVLEERASAVLAFLSSLSFCLGNLLRAVGQYWVVAATALLLLGVWSFLDGHWETTGYKTQIVTLLLAQGLMAGRMALRLALLGAQVGLYRRLTAYP